MSVSLACYTLPTYLLPAHCRPKYHNKQDVGDSVHTASHTPHSMCVVLTSLAWNVVSLVRPLPAMHVGGSGNDPSQTDNMPM